MAQPSKTIRVPEPLHKKISIQAVREGIFPYELIDKAVNEYIKKRNKK